MPYLDKTGPLGEGPLTGRGSGPCGGSFGFGRRFFGRGFFGRGRGFGLERLAGWFNRPTKESDLNSVKQYKEALKQELNDIENTERELSK